SLTDLLLAVSERTDLPLVVAENGAAFADEVSGDRVHDAERTRYLAEHIRAVHRALQRGADVRGYLVWSLMDNFEWAMGFTQRFGIVHVDFVTQRRRIKDSGLMFSEVARSNMLPASVASPDDGYRRRPLVDPDGCGWPARAGAARSASTAERVMPRRVVTPSTCCTRSTCSRTACGDNDSRWAMSLSGQPAATRSATPSSTGVSQCASGCRNTSARRKP